MAAPTAHLGKTAVFIAMIWSGAVAQAYEFAGGTGEPNDPYQIATAEQLLSIGSDPNLRNQDYVLVADIDLSGTSFSKSPIPVLFGVFDGNGHVIRNLTVHDDANFEVGLFSRVEMEGEVRNLGLKDVTVTGKAYVGGLAGVNNGTLTNCYSEGTVSAKGGVVGGLVGSCFYVVSHCHSAGTVTAISGTGVGGLVGEGDALTLSRCYSSCAVTGYRNVGGLIGYGRNSTLSCCYATGNVTGQEYLGGLGGNWDHRIYDSYATGSVTGQACIGGLVGRGTYLFRCYSTSRVAGSGDYVGGLAGSASQKRDCYFLAPAEGGGPDNGIGKPLTQEQLKRQASFAGFDFWGQSMDGTRDLWFMPQDACPVLSSQAQITGLLPIPDVSRVSSDEAQVTLVAAGFTMGSVKADFCRVIPAGRVIHASPHSFAPAGALVDIIVSSDQAYDWSINGEDGTASNPYLMKTAGQLESLTVHPELWGKCFVLVSDLDMINRTYSRALMAPDINDLAGGFQGTAFTGSFNGNGQRIVNLSIDCNNCVVSYLGLFGMIGAAGQVNGLTLHDISIMGGGKGMMFVAPSNGSDYLGTFTGWSVSDFAGTLAGYNAGMLVDCVADEGTVWNACFNAGGLVGYSSSTLTNCHADRMEVRTVCTLRR